VWHPHDGAQQPDLRPRAVGALVHLDGREKTSPARDHVDQGGLLRVLATDVVPDLELVCIVPVEPPQGLRPGRNSRVVYRDVLLLSDQSLLEQLALHVGCVPSARPIAVLPRTTALGDRLPPGVA